MMKHSKTITSLLRGNVLKCLFAITLAGMFSQSNARSYGIPVDSNATQRTKNLLSCLSSYYGVHCVSGIYGNAGTANINGVISCSGQMPAILGMDLCGWNSVKYSAAYQANIQGQINILVNHYNNGGIVQMEWHWPNPFQTSGTFNAAQIALTSTQWDSITVSGSSQYNTMMADLAWHANYLRQLDSLNIPVLWRPLHEIDGGWFWWTNPNTKSGKTAELWRIVYNYLVNVCGFHNLIWVYCSGMASYTNPSVSLLDSAAVAWRQTYYPGAQYVDIAGIDLYGWDYQNTGTHTYTGNQTASYTTMWNMMSQIAPGKMLALCECQALPDPRKMANNDPAFQKWLYAMPWYANDTNNPCTWINTSYNDSFMRNVSSLCNYVDVVASHREIPTDHTLEQNYPNPFNPRTVIHYQLSTRGNVVLNVYDVLGRKIVTLVDEQQPAGTYIVEWNAADVPSGVYLCRLTLGSLKQTKKMILQR
jgi:hypothetical protein